MREPTLLSTDTYNNISLFKKVETEFHLIVS